MSCYEALKIVLGLSRDIGLVYMMNVNNWDRRCAHCSSKGSRVGLQSYGWLGAVGEASEGIYSTYQCFQSVYQPQIYASCIWYQ